MRPELSFLAGLLTLAFLSMAVYKLRENGRKPDKLDVKDRGSFVLGGFVRDWFYWFLWPVEAPALKSGLGPLVFNLAGVGFGILAGVGFALGHPALGGWAVFLGGVADILDGRVARARGLASPRGAFLDSTLDRFAEVGAFAGLAVFFHQRPLVSLLVILALGGSLMVSYTRARGESQGVVCKVGIMQRAERLLLLGFGGILDPSVSEWTGWEQGTLLVAVMAVIAVGTLGTAIYRTVWITKRLPSGGPDPS